MENHEKHGYILWIIVAIVLTAILVGGGVYYWQNKKATETQNDLNNQITNLQNQINTLKSANSTNSTSTSTNTNPTNNTSTSTNTTTDETANWNTYTNSKYGYSIKYPSDWKQGSSVIPSDELIDFIQTSDKNNYGFISIEVLSQRSDGASDIDSLRDVMNKTNASTHLKETETTFSGKPAIELISQAVNGVQYDSIYFINGNQRFEISYNCDGANINIEQCGSYTLYKKILNTFSF